MGSVCEGVFADHTAYSLVAVYPERVEIGDGRRERFEGRGLAEGAVRPVGVVMGPVSTQDLEQVALVPDQRLAAQFPAATPDPPFHDRVRSRRADRAAQDPDPLGGEDGVEGGGEFRVPISKEEPHRRNLLVEGHEQVTGICVTHASLG